MLLEGVTEWWVASRNSAGDLVGQKGIANLVAFNAPPIVSDGVQTWAQLRAASSQAFGAAHQAALDPGAGSFVLGMVFAPQVNLTGAKTPFSKRVSTGLGWQLKTDTVNPSGVLDTDIAAAVTFNGPALTLGARTIVALVRDGTNARAITNGVAGTNTAVGSGDLANTQEFRFGRTNNAVSQQFMDMDLLGAWWWKGAAMTDAETVVAGHELLLANSLMPRPSVAGSFDPGWY